MKLGFSGLLKANFLGPQPGQGGTKHRWELTEALSFTFKMSYNDQQILKMLCLDDVHVDKNDVTVTVPVGFVTDLASIPRPVWVLISPWDVARSAVVHDLLYRKLREMKDKLSPGDKSAIRAVSDIVFLEGMKASEPSVPTWKIQACYQSVKVFGRWAIK